VPKRRRRRNEGSVFFDRVNRTWVARISLGTRDGRRVGKKVRAESEAAARQELERLRRAYLASVDPTHDSLDAYLSGWLASHGPSVRDSTRVSYAGHIALHISPLLGGIPVSRLKPSDVRRLIADRLAAGLSPATVRRVHSTLYMALQQGVKDRTLADNPAAGVPLPRVPDRPVEAMTEDRADAIRDAVRGTFLGNLTELLLGSALRLGEALGLDQGDIGDGFVLVRRSKTRVRAVMVTDDAAVALKRQVASSKRRGPKEPVFFGPKTGERLTGSTVSHAFPKLLQRAGLPRLSPHGLRHGAATIMLTKGAPMRVIAEQLGHRNPSLTARVYAHVVPEAQRDAVRLLGRRKA
jgi:integrase